jgi:hypothetical protein
MTIQDFHVPGTQVGDVPPGAIATSAACYLCHGPFDPENDPMSSWQGSLMGLAGRDPLFFAQMANANQDVGNAGSFCLRCHVPMSVVTGHALQPLGDTLDETDLDGVTCHFCHSMADPVYTAGTSPPEDEAVLAGLDEVPSHYGNAMFVLDPSGTRRGPRPDAQAPHQVIYSPFHRSGDMCGTCHDVGNVAVSRAPDGTYAYNAIGEPAPDEDLWAQFPLERTWTEWKLSAFAAGGVDMGGRFGGEGATVVSTCQDCHMPRVEAEACVFGPTRPDMRRHEFAGAAAPVLDLIAAYWQGDPAVNQEAVARGRARSVSMLERAATLEVEQACGALRVRVVNESGHKLPTGHIEGRRVWVNVRFLDAAGAVLAEHGGYDPAEAHLDEATTRVYEMKVGLSAAAAKMTDLPAGVTTHMALADTIESDTRIPPRGFDRAAYEAGGAPAVRADYADGQHWDEAHFSVPDGAASAEVAVRYQSLTRHYVEALRDGNVTDDWGEILHGLWESTGRGAPIAMASAGADLAPFARGDIDCDGWVGIIDFLALLQHWGARFTPADLDGDTEVNAADLALLLLNWG